jgi:16S rRNA (uracil1498-N3)-methyltransferase
MRRAHVEPSVLDAVAADGTLALPAPTAHRFARVLRLPDGEPVELFDGTGRVARGTLATSGTAPALAGVVVEQRGDGLPPLVLAQATVATDKLELVVQKATELGVARVALFDAARSQVRLKAERLEKRQARLARIAEDAARQCGRASVPDISFSTSAKVLADSLRTAASGAAIVVGALHAASPLSEVLAAAQVETAGVVVVIGPEGGLDPSEIAAFEAAGAIAVRLGAHVLRTETAGLVALAAIQARLGLL